MKGECLDGAGPRTVGAGGIAKDQTRWVWLRGNLKADFGLGFDQAAVQVNPGALGTGGDGPQGGSLGEL